MNPVRNSAKAVIIQDGKLLTIQCVSWKKETYYILPGGGQNAGETLKEALCRECREEIRADVKVGCLRWVREYIGRNHEFAEKHSDIHGVEFMFECSLKPGAVLALGGQPDDYQTGVSWLAISELPSVKFFPKALIKHLTDEVRGLVYLGDVN